MNIPKVKQERALRIALDLVSDVTLREVWDTVACLTDHGEKIAAAIDPEINKYSDERFLELEEAIKAKLDEEGKKLFFEYDNAWCDRDFCHRVSNFYLGYATAIKLLSCSRPALKIIEGGKAPAPTLKGELTP